MRDEIAKALARFSKERSTKRGFLFTRTNAYYLYDSRFCSLCDYQIRLQSPACNMNTDRIDTPLFVGVVEKTLQYAAIPKHLLPVEYLRLLFHVASGSESDELLRGILVSKGTEARLAVFTDPAIEEMFLEAEAVNRSPPIVSDCKIAELQQHYARNDLRLLVELYMQGAEMKNKAVELYEN